MGYYSRPVESPKTQREGLCNFVQMIINDIESGEHREALLRAVDLLEDLRCGAYASETLDGKTALASLQAAHARELADKLAATDAAAYERGHADGVSFERKRIGNVLGLAP